MACAGDWIKILAADDILLPDCIQKYVAYLTKHPDANFIFSKVEIFGENDDFVDYFDYSFFSKSRNEQLHQLIFQGNCIPAPSAFFRTEYVRQLGITNDERVPLIEDLPKWINLLNKGTEFSFIDDTLVKYRTGGTTGKALMSRALYHSNRLLTFLYLFPAWERNGYEYAFERIIEEEMEIYDNLLSSNSQIQKIKKSHAYKLGKLIVKPFSSLKSLLSK